MTLQAHAQHALPANCVTSRPTGHCPVTRVWRPLPATSLLASRAYLMRSLTPPRRHVKQSLRVWEPSTECSIRRSAFMAPTLTQPLLAQLSILCKVATSIACLAPLEVLVQAHQHRPQRQPVPMATGVTRRTRKLARSVNTPAHPATRALD